MLQKELQLNSLQFFQEYCVSASSLLVIEKKKNFLMKLGLDSLWCFLGKEYMRVGCTRSLMCFTLRGLSLFTHWQTENTRTILF